MFILGFKARVSSLIDTWQRCSDIHSLKFTPGATPLPVFVGSIAASHFPHMRVSAVVLFLFFCQNHFLNLNSTILGRSNWSIDLMNDNPL